MKACGKKRRVGLSGKWESVHRCRQPLRAMTHGETSEDATALTAESTHFQQGTEEEVANIAYRCKGEVRQREPSSTQQASPNQHNKKQRGLKRGINKTQIRLEQPERGRKGAEGSRQTTEPARSRPEEVKERRNRQGQEQNEKGDNSCVPQHQARTRIGKARRNRCGAGGCDPKCSARRSLHARTLKPQAWTLSYDME